MPGGASDGCRHGRPREPELIVRPVRAVVALLAVASVGSALVADVARAQQPSPPSPTTPVLSVRRVPSLVADQVAVNRLVGGLDAAVAAAPPEACLVVSDPSGVRFARNPDRPLVPASTLKVATAAVALDLWGPDHRFVTTVSATSPPAGGRVEGDLYLIGGGDPVLGTAGYAASLPGGPGRTRSSLEALADSVAATGLREVTGAVVGDGSRHDSARSVAGWDPSYLVGDTVGSLGALRVNGGLNGWVEEPGRSGRRGQPGDPAGEAAAIFTTLLAQRGVTVGSPGRSGVASPGASSVAAHASPPLSAILGEVLRWSDNGASEQLLREIGLGVSGAGSTATGAASVAATLARWGLPTTGVVVADGSGLHTGNRVTCALLVALMERVTADPVLVENLPVAGQSGTLAGRLTEEGTAGLVRAKTGTLDTVRALAGAALGGDGRLAHFAWVSNGARDDPALSVTWPDAAVRVIRAFPDRPPLDALGPSRVP